MSQFYALMSDNTVKHISLKEEIVTEIKNIFINGGAIFKPEGIEEEFSMAISLAGTGRI